MKENGKEMAILHGDFQFPRVVLVTLDLDLYVFNLQSLPFSKPKHKKNLPQNLKLQNYKPFHNTGFHHHIPSHPIQTSMCYISSWKIQYAHCHPHTAIYLEFIRTYLEIYHQALNALFLQHDQFFGPLFNCIQYFFVGSEQRFYFFFLESETTGFVVCFIYKTKSILEAFKRSHCIAC